tara:strand:+ start:5447 stop:5668 length:222 start_codon:yes stop_codon:yes gene_type:complete
LKFGIRRPGDSGQLVKEKGGWGKYHKWLERKGIARWDSASQSLIPMPQTATKKIGRNEPCPCDSGKKYKKCCL